MRYSGWFLTLGFLTVGLGFGHAGCYTSGTPGGLAVGGSNAGGTSNSNQGGSSQDGDSGADASDASGGCVNSRSCSLDEVCDQISHRCVGCVGDNDCAPSVQRCANHSCLDIVKCTTDKQCTPLGQLCDPVNLYCVGCMAIKDCDAGMNCTEGLCI